MPRNPRNPRRLKVGDDTYIWTLTHDHEPKIPRTCRNVLKLRHHEATGRLILVFQEAPGRIVTGAHTPSGYVATEEAHLNLHRPGAVRALLDEALARGWNPVTATTREQDGWPLLAPAATRLADIRTR
ncbi:hypothetical protein [Actinomadura rubteroloni]|uniref:hypothetical protein n=1 Tax=Actinomadura rubteroloni TaxID=1926885 RepID=UPI000CD9555C|nr:hypothetical protein [Actinomadura rubteroloni]